MKRKANDNDNDSNPKKGDKNTSWKKKMNKAIKTSDSLTHVHIMSILSEEEAANAALIASITQPGGEDKNISKVWQLRCNCNQF